jgi:hypothetical protein
MPDCPAELSFTVIRQLYPITSANQPGHRRAVRTLGRVPKTVQNKLVLTRMAQSLPPAPRGLLKTILTNYLFLELRLFFVEGCIRKFYRVKCKANNYGFETY